MRVLAYVAAYVVLVAAPIVLMWAIYRRLSELLTAEFIAAVQDAVVDDGEHAWIDG